MNSSPLVVLGLGSNLGDSKQIVLDALGELEPLLGDLKRASLYETEPLHVTDQGRFINTAAAGFYPAREDAQSARELLKLIQGIEKKYGRDRSKERRWGERYLDIDILLFGNLVMSEPELEIPHPRLCQRRFALEPLLELFPAACEPGTGKSYRDICQNLPVQGLVLKQ